MSDPIIRGFRRRAQLAALSAPVMLVGVVTRILSRPDTASTQYQIGTALFYIGLAWLAVFSLWAALQLVRGLLRR